MWLSGNTSWEVFEIRKFSPKKSISAFVIQLRCLFYYNESLCFCSSWTSFVLIPEKEGIIKTPVILLSIKNSKEKFYIDALELALQLPNSLKVRSLNLKSSPDHPRTKLLFNWFFLPLQGIHSWSYFRKLTILECVGKMCSEVSFAKTDLF